MPTSTQIDLTLASLAEAIDGHLVLPSDADWDEARRAWNLAVEQLPEAVVYPAGVDDVIAVVEFARDHGLGIAVQGTGHGACARSSLEGAILLNTARWDEFEIDPEARRARVAAGTLWGSVSDAAGRFGLAPLAGSVRSVGVVGYTLGGGLSRLGRRYGLAANSVRAIELVTADGRYRCVDRDNDAELFWALRGGGGNFGVVTAMEFELYPIAEVYAGWLLWPAKDAAEMFKLYRQWVETLPDELSSVVRLLHLPPLETIPEPLRGRSWVGFEAAYLGDGMEGVKLLEPLRQARPVMDTFATRPATAGAHLLNDPSEPFASIVDGMLIDDLTPDVIDALVNVVGDARTTQLLGIELLHLGGALARPTWDEGALPALDGEFAVLTGGISFGPDHTELVKRDMAAALAVFEPCSSGRVYLNFKDQPGDASAGFAEDTYRRLREIKAAYDPSDLFRSNHPIEPAR